MQKMLQAIKRRAQLKPRLPFDKELPGYIDRFLLLDPKPQAPHDKAVRIAIERAIVAANLGNFAVGAVLTDSQGRVMERGEARVLRPYYRTDLHAEMHVLTKYETRMRFGSLEQRNAKMQGSTLFSSVEPCPMCFSRLILSGVSKIFYAAEELRGGMVHLFVNLPEIWQEIYHLAHKEARLADCSPEYKQFALDLFLASAAASCNDQHWPIS